MRITKLMLQPLNAEEDFHKPVLREFLEAMNTRGMDSKLSRQDELLRVLEKKS